MAVAAVAQQVKPAIAGDAAIEKKVEQTLRKMTLEEKVGQMMELTLDVFGHFNSQGKWELNMAKLDSILTNFKVGSILNVPGSYCPTRQEWEEWIGVIQDLSVKRTGIPCIYGLDENHGSTYIQGGTLFPQNINMAATFNRDLARRCAEVTAYEARAASVPWTYSPTVDLGRDPRWPRMWENFGEDCYVGAEMSKAMVRGFQGDDPNHIDQQHIAVSVKHFMGYSVPVSGKDRTPAVISPSDLREKHFAAYKAAIEAGALTVMVNSASINGVPVHANRELLTGWLKEGLNWDGMIVTDWADVNNLWQREHVAKDKKEALKLAINAGIDMIMEPYQCDACGLLVELAKEGGIPMSRIDDAVRRVLRLKYRLGLFDHPAQRVRDYPKFGCDEFGKLALEGAEESIVLLKNEGNLLPLAKGKKILLTGPNANTMRCLNGGWSYSWQGHMADNYAGAYNTIYEALCEKYGKENVVLEQGVTYNEKGQWWEENAPEIDKAVSAASGADVIIACVGENSYCETPGNLSDLWLSANQRALVKALAKTGKPILLVLNEGRPRLIADIEPLAKAVVDVILPGNYGGDALANLLAGDSNFSGKLPFTYPKEINSLITYDYKLSEQVETMAGAYDYNAKVVLQWGFGHGLSYTTYKYANLRVDKSHFKADDVLTVSVDVTNTGSRAGKESVLLFSSDLVASVIPDCRRLRDFQKVELQPGETKTVVFKLKAADLAFVGFDGQWVLEEGDFRLQVADQVVEIVCEETRRI